MELWTLWLCNWPLDPWMPCLWGAVKGNELKLILNTNCSQQGLTPQDMNGCSKKRIHGPLRNRYEDPSDPNNADFGWHGGLFGRILITSFLASEKGSGDKEWITRGPNSSVQNVIFNVIPVIDAVVYMLCYKRKQALFFWCSPLISGCNQRGANEHFSLKKSGIYPSC